jgi:hypothetical protein
VIYFLLPPGVLWAAANINITSVPPSVIAGQEFEIGFKGEGLGINLAYNLKGLGGENFTEVDTWNNQWLQQNASWEKMPAFLSETDGSPSGTFKVRFDSNAVGAKDLKIRVKKPDSSEGNIDSEVVTISVAAAPQTPTPTVMLTTTPVSIPKTTSVPVITPVPSPLKSTLLHVTSTPEVKAEILGEAASNLNLILPPTPESSAKNKTQGKFPGVAFGLIFLGLALIGGSSYAYFKTNNKVTHEETLI